MTVTVKRAPAELPDAGVIEEARARQRRQRRLAGAASVAAAVIAAVLLAFVGGGSSRSAGSPTSHRRPSSSAARVSLASCASRAKALDGAPSRSLLSILGVLRRPAGAADSPSPAVERDLLGGGAIRGVFVHYIRRARAIDGATYWIYPVITGGCGSGRRREVIAELGGRVDSRGRLQGSGSSGAGAAELEREGMFGSSGSGHSSLLTGVLPDGVATVSVHYPAGPASGFSHEVLPAVTITARVVGNVAVARVPRASGLRWQKMVWRSATGKVVETVPPES